MPAPDNSKHSGGPVGPNVMADDGVRRCEVVARQIEFISLRAEKRSTGSSRVRNSQPVSPMIPASRLAHWIAMQLRTSFVHSDRTPVEHLSIQRRNSRLGFRCLRHLHEGDAAGFARIPVLDDRDGFDGSMCCKNLPQLMFRYRDIQAPNKDVSHEFILFLIFPKSHNQERNRNFKRRS